ncbi:MAG TPA: PhzF family phenazine biosynthesis protein [Draconibacterium sp.]|nr:PhzF family phenazine biosynthesis protein [Draconibacterium sp.]
MDLTIYQVDAFAENVFRGNPAAVVPLKSWLPDETLQNIAQENNLSETAFFIYAENGFYIRWFTPVVEVNLCGHATLATAHVLFNHLNYSEKEIKFESRSGILRVKKEGEWLVLNFPASFVKEIEMPKKVKEAFSNTPQKCFRGRDDLMLIYRNEEDILNLNPNFQKIDEIDVRGIIVTAKSEKFDFVSRFFAPAVGVNEDPVTGSAHTMLIPYWSKKLNKTELTAKQVSARGGILKCNYLNDRVEIGGKAVTYLTGTIVI